MRRPIPDPSTLDAAANIRRAQEDSKLTRAADRELRKFRAYIDAVAEMTRKGLGAEAAAELFANVACDLDEAAKEERMISELRSGVPRGSFR